MFSSLQALLLGLCLAFASDGAKTGPASASAASPDAPSKSSSPTSIVIGFVGGFVRSDDRLHTEVQLADRLRGDFAPQVAVQLFANHRGKTAYDSVLRLLDRDHDGALSRQEKQNARIIIFGHSWGASETVELARQLEKDGIPVVLTIQVDSVSKFGRNDSLIPANVAQAVNFYQTDGVLHGEPAIRAADPSHTRILGNFRSDYKSKPLSCGGQYPWWDRAFMRPHIQIECDPDVWGKVESLIRSNLSFEAREARPLVSVPPATASSRDQ
jgi:hypothetical protein